MKRSDAARPCRLRVVDRWFVDETYVMVNGIGRYVYRAVDKHGLVIDELIPGVLRTSACMRTTGVRGTTDA